jgi:uncharacterized protein YbaA (DUF1428 family)
VVEHNRAAAIKRAHGPAAALPLARVHHTAPEGGKPSACISTDSWFQCPRTSSPTTGAARKFGKLWMQVGELEVHECTADDVKPGKLTSFPQPVKLKPDELVVFPWIVFKSHRHRDAVNKKVMADPLMAQVDPKSMPFRGQRMSLGGLKEIVRL